jgi:aminomethyltransferase
MEVQLTMAIGTPFHSRTAPLNTSLHWKHWSGYFSAVIYEDFSEPEYQAVRNGAALIDVSPLYKYDIRGSDAVALVDRLITRNAAKCKLGQVLYTPWCDDDGKILQDGCFQRLEENHFRATAVDPCLHWFYANTAGLNVEIDDVSEKMGALALQGPTSRDILNHISSTDLTDLRYFYATGAELGGAPVVVSRTGYTGDLGYEIWVGTEDAERVWDALMEAGRGRGIVPAGMEALDLARIEAGYPLIDVDFWNAEKALIEDQKSSPYEVGMGWAVNLKKSRFIGKQALVEEKKAGTPRFFMGLEVSWEAIEPLYTEEGLAPEMPQVASRVGIPIYIGGRQVGKATSSCWSKLLKKFIALATLDAPYAKPGTEVDLEMTVEYKRKRAAAKVVKLPFFDPERKRA